MSKRVKHNESGLTHPLRTKKVKMQNHVTGLDQKGRRRPKKD